MKSGGRRGRAGRRAEARRRGVPLDGRGRRRRAGAALPARRRPLPSGAVRAGRVAASRRRRLGRGGAEGDLRRRRRRSASRPTTRAAPAAPAGDCDDHCPLCQFAAQAATLVAPDLPALPARLDAACLTLGAAPEPGADPALRRRHESRPRAALRRLRLSPSGRAPPERARRCSQTRRIPFMSTSHFPRLRRRDRRRSRIVAHARLSARRVRRPHLPGDARHRRSRRSGRADAADRQLGPQQFRRRPRVGRELQLDQDDHPGPQRRDRLGSHLEHPGGYGWNPLDTEMQYQLLCIPDAEFMMKVGFDVSWAGTGTGNLAGSGRENTYSPLVAAGLGFGTLPTSLYVPSARSRSPPSSARPRRATTG